MSFLFSIDNNYFKIDKSATFLSLLRGNLSHPRLISDKELDNIVITNLKEDNKTKITDQIKEGKWKIVSREREMQVEIIVWGKV